MNIIDGFEKFHKTTVHRVAAEKKTKSRSPLLGYSTDPSANCSWQARRLAAYVDNDRKPVTTVRRRQSHRCMMTQFNRCPPACPPAPGRLLCLLRQEIQPRRPLSMTVFHRRRRISGGHDLWRSLCLCTARNIFSRSAELMSTCFAGYSYRNSPTGLHSDIAGDLSNNVIKRLQLFCLPVR